MSDTIEDKIIQTINDMPWATSPVEEKGVLWRFHKSWLKVIAKELANLFLSQHQSDMEKFKEALGEETTNEYWMKRLKVPSSDYSYGHMHGWNIHRQEVLTKLKEEV
jgi:hypothetical protein